MSEKIKKLIVCLFDERVGVLNEVDGRLSFQYTKDAKYPISVSIPIREEAYNNNDTQKFFANLLPEGDPREKIAKFYNIKESLFPMLKAIGGECAGAISLYSEGGKNSCGNHNDKSQLFTREEFNEHINSLPNRPLSIGNKVRLSLAGAQAKTAVLIKNDDFSILYPRNSFQGFKNIPYKFQIHKDDNIRIYRPSNGEFSTHIVKPPIKDLEDTVENELFCMLLAYNLSDSENNLIVPRVTFYKNKNTKCLFVQRYDRFVDDINESNFRFKRLHQEDFCQVLSIYPEKKYQEDGGASIKQCFKIINEYITFKAEAIDRMLNVIIFNYLIGNCDSHGKNYSIIHNSILYSFDYHDAFGKFLHTPYNERISLAPFYDLMSTEIYNKSSEPGSIQSMAMAIGEEYDPKKITLAHFERMAKELDIKPIYILEKISRISSVIVNKAEMLKSSLENENIKSPVFEKIIELIKSRVKMLQ